MIEKIETKEYIATGSTNGSVLLWNIEALRKTERVRIINSHNRTVHRLCWHMPSCLMSCSQDGTVKYIDTRDKNGKAITFDLKSG